MLQGLGSAITLHFTNEATDARDVRSLAQGHTAYKIMEPRSEPDSRVQALNHYTILYLG